MKKTQLVLDELADPEAEDTALPIEVNYILIKEPPPPKAFENFRKMRQLGILTGDGLVALVANAPIDPINLMGTLMRLYPDSWAFSALDFSMVRVIAKEKGVVFAAMHVDLISGDVIKFLARNKAGQLVEYKSLTVTAGPETQKNIQAMVEETIAAAAREART